MKIAMVGCGAVGGYYGAKLGRSGQDLHFLLRSDYDVVRENGVLVQSPEGDFRYRPQCARRPAEIGLCDLVVVALKTTANDQFSKLLPPLVGPGTAVLTLQNGLGNEEELARWFPADQILGGLCFVCLNRVAPGVIRHLDHGTIVLGEFRRPPGPRTGAIADVFRNAGVDCRVSGNLAQAHWEKLVWNIPFNGLGVASAAGYAAMSGPQAPVSGRPGPCLATDQLLADPGWERLVKELMLEVIRSARALGFSIPETLADRQMERTRTMGSYLASTLLDFEQGRALELESLFQEPLRQARAAGVSVPRLERLCEVLGQLNCMRRGIS